MKFINKVIIFLGMIEFLKIVIIYFFTHHEKFENSPCPSYKLFLIIFEISGSGGTNMLYDLMGNHPGTIISYCPIMGGKAGLSGAVGVLRDVQRYMEKIKYRNEFILLNPYQISS